MRQFEHIALIAGTLTLIAFSNLVYIVHKTKITKNFSYVWIFLTIIAQTLLLFYGIINGTYGIYITSTGILLGVFYILYVKMKYK